MDNIKKILVQDERYRERIETCLKSPSVFIAPTNYCNFSCLYCSTKNTQKSKINIDLDFAKTIVDQCIENNWDFSFGQTYEPFLHPKISRLIRYVHENGKVFSSATNAMKIPADVFDLPMNLIISYSADESDYRFRQSSLAYDLYQNKIVQFVRHRIANTIPGLITLQIADYSIFKGVFAYDKRIYEVGQIYQKSQKLLRQLGLAGSVDDSEWRNNISQRRALVLFESQCTKIQVEPTKIMPNTYEAFASMPLSYENRGYCDSCFTTMSIQADGEVAFCCCDPTAQVVAGAIDLKSNLRDFWLGREMSEIRNSFRMFAPKHSFCAQCLSNVSENIKPLLTVKDPALVAAILASHGIVDDLPWCSFPKPLVGI
ncbi:hypothetical protein GTA51_03735 [Desulfovibrio aerotolerans]|uniref:4Fe4S-binding SPASM domain-containing protein n=1 Tax=Solidesulfovibrio aerotolerans TaxID=295255 RepID=A0A7C9MGY7_9BACT|nr:SPASM domain-containing protein [Solidesulfovibrio aerotolerans]MYL82248.1 hypothetical protein [Solidesulfovibrio aerotolerans]